MAVKTDTEVIIGGKVFTLSGYESEEYLQKVASYINNKMSEYSKLDSFRRQPVDRQNVLLQLNIADDYFKARKQIALLEEDIRAKEKELYDLKHELIASQIKLENSEKSLKGLQRDLNESSKKIIRLETELADNKKKGNGDPRQKSGLVFIREYVYGFMCIKAVYKGQLFYIRIFVRERKTDGNSYEKTGITGACRRLFLFQGGFKGRSRCCLYRGTEIRRQSFCGKLQ